MEGNGQRFNTYREGITGNEEGDSDEEESSILNESSLLEEESGEDSEDNGTDEKDVSKEQNVNEELTSVEVKSEPTRSTRNKKEFMISIIDMSVDVNAITLKITYPNSFRKETTKTRIFIL